MCQLIMSPIVVSSAKTASKKLFKQITPLFALDFSTKVVFIKQNFALIKYMRI